ncbi:hypothetical protein ZWY2020_059271 [Hordeum vulgare]|nr:hypothetical protein ZWY2020_058161 [Hordeum vulgare]KAI5022541.1 hypothetical protein ZWY2020_059271 [Hordeum vulgare]
MRTRPTWRLQVQVQAMQGKVDDSMSLIVFKMANDEDSLEDQNPKSWTVSNTSIIDKKEEASSKFSVQDHQPQRAVVNFLKDESTTKTIHEQWQEKAKVAS